MEIYSEKLGKNITHRLLLIGIFALTQASEIFYVQINLYFFCLRGYFTSPRTSPCITFYLLELISNLRIFVLHPVYIVWNIFEDKNK